MRYLLIFGLLCWTSQAAALFCPFTGGKHHHRGHRFPPIRRLPPEGFFPLMPPPPLQVESGPSPSVPQEAPPAAAEPEIIDGYRFRPSRRGTLSQQQRIRRGLDK